MGGFRESLENWEDYLRSKMELEGDGDHLESVKRDSDSDPGLEEGASAGDETETRGVWEDTNKIVGERLGLSNWQTVAAIIVFACLCVGLCGWCTWRFFKKKRPKDKKKDGKKQVVYSVQCTVYSVQCTYDMISGSDH